MVLRTLLGLEFLEKSIFFHKLIH